MDATTFARRRIDLGQVRSLRTIGADTVAEIYKAMRRKSGKGPFWTEIKRDFRKVIHAADYDARIKGAEALLAEMGLGEIPRYSKHDWIDAALDRKEESLVMHEGFEETDWVHFHQAAKIQFATVLDLTKEL